MLYVSVTNGTNAGRRRPKANPHKVDWECPNGHLNKFYWKNCPACGAQRPERS